MLCAVIVFLAWSAIHNAAENLARAKIASGFGFWDNTAGFDISQTLIDYPTTSTYGRAFWVGLLNTLLVAALGIVLATILGFLIGIARLSKNWLLARMAGFYVETIRNIPLLLQLLFWYNAVLKALPGTRESLAIPGGGFLNNRGLFLPQPVFEPGVALCADRARAGRCRRDRLSASGRGAGRCAPASRRRCCGSRSASSSRCRSPCWRCRAFRSRSTFPRPGASTSAAASRCCRSSWRCCSGSSIYTAAFIAEVVRAGIRVRVARARPRPPIRSDCGPGRRLRLVVIPQAMRVIIPPLTSQYLNLTKNSTLAVAIGYPDLVQIFAGTVLNQTGQAVEVIVITMAVYLTISLVTSALMNLYNRRMALVER